MIAHTAIGLRSARTRANRHTGFGTAAWVRVAGNGMPHPDGRRKYVLLKGGRHTG